MQRLMAHRPSLIEAELKGRPGFSPSAPIEWRSPLAADQWAEYRDGAFLNRVGLDSLRPKLRAFWPRGGPQWDALARTADGKVVLVEAKAHIPELRSSCSASPRSRERIERALEQAKAFYSVPAEADWLSGYYQYANRLAHAYFLREHGGVDAHLVFLYFCGDADMKGPDTPAAWQAALEPVHAALQLPTGDLPGVHDVYLDVHALA